MSILTNNWRGLLLIIIIFALMLDTDHALANEVDYRSDPVIKRVCDIAAPKKNIIDDDLKIRTFDKNNLEVPITHLIPLDSVKKSWLLEVDGFMPATITYANGKQDFNIWDGRRNYICPNPDAIQ